MVTWFRHLCTKAAACLALLPLLGACPLASAQGDVLSLDGVEESFEGATRVHDLDEMGVTVFAAGGLNCVALADSRSKVHYIFLLPRTKPRNEAEVEAFTAETERMQGYVASLVDDPDVVRLIPFSQPGKGAVLALVPRERKSNFVRSVLGDETVRVIDEAVNCGAGFESLENGELTLVLPSRDCPGERCALVLSLHKQTVELICYSPPPSKGKKEEAAVSALSTDLNIMRSAVDTRANAEALAGVCKQTGASRCLAKGNAYAVVLLNKKLCVGSPTALRHYIKDRKKDPTAGGYLGEFSFPSTAPAIPVPGGEPASQEDATPEPDPAPAGQDTPPAPADAPVATPADAPADTPAAAPADAQPPADAAAHAAAHAAALGEYLQYLKRLERR